MCVCVCVRNRKAERGDTRCVLLEISVSAGISDRGVCFNALTKHWSDSLTRETNYLHVLCGCGEKSAGFGVLCVEQVDFVFISIWLYRCRALGAGFTTACMPMEETVCQFSHRAEVELRCT